MAEGGKVHCVNLLCEMVPDILDGLMKLVQRLHLASDCGAHEIVLTCFKLPVTRTHWTKWDELPS